MLTPHELAQLFVIVNAPATADAANPELETLVEQDLVQCVARAGEPIELHVTARGAEVLARLARSAAPSQTPATPAR